MRRIPVRSSCIHSVGYDEQLSLLEIQFHSSSVYQYFNVTLNVYESLINASSKGKYFNRFISPKYKYRLVDGQSSEWFPKNKFRHEHPVSQEKINSLYRKLAFEFHPDRITGFEDVMKKINTLYGERNYSGLVEIALSNKISAF